MSRPDPITRSDDRAERRGLTLPAHRCAYCGTEKSGHWVVLWGTDCPECGIELLRPLPPAPRPG